MFSDEEEAKEVLAMDKKSINAHKHRDIFIT
jgi:hypothetical protein